MADPEILPDATITPPTTNPSTSNNKKKRKQRPTKPHVLSQLTLRHPQWTYIHLHHLTSNPPPADLDAVTAHLHLQAALSQFLGLHGAAIGFDILKLVGQDVWIRVPHEDAGALTAAVGGWVSSKGEGWQVKGTSSWDARAVGVEGGRELFGD